MLLLVLLVILLFAAGGGWGQARFGTAAWSPLGVIVLIVVVLWLTGNLRLR